MLAADLDFQAYIATARFRRAGACACNIAHDTVTARTARKEHMLVCMYEAFHMTAAMLRQAMHTCFCCSC